MRNEVMAGLALLALGMGLSACPEIYVPPDPAECEVDELRPCNCPDGSTADQVCIALDDGTVTFGKCDCPEPDAITTDTEGDTPNDGGPEVTGCQQLGDPCDDEDPCTKNGVCNASLECVAEPACTSDLPCVEATCDDGICGTDAASLEGDECDDGDACTIDDTCQSGACAGVTPDDLCDDGEECTDDSCNPATGCSHKNVAATTPCDDGNWCTENDECGGGACVGTDRVCDDFNQCTENSCDPDGEQCVFDKAPLEGESCADLCQTNPVCTNGACVGTPIVCNDNNVCTGDTCNKQTGQCQYNAATKNGEICDDGLWCSPLDKCLNGACVADAAAGTACDDSNPCTIDLCTENADTPGQPGTCQNLPVTSADPCDDGDGCTDNDRCQAGECLGDPIAGCS